MKNSSQSLVKYLKMFVIYRIFVRHILSRTDIEETCFIRSNLALNQRLNSYDKILIKYFRVFGVGSLIVNPSLNGLPLLETTQAH
jgi:hypothetical protein